ncbi:4-oxalocrotonate tautomerase family enzyme [Hafnia alvei ATCC 51873]|jgi:4-oxalocrotonate tautomerase|uniref:Tautomerase n=2 Tax=Hafniaceae TaxID=1903412 RepID=G9Y498_HAFAL|nr:4-oxalocrotonate tautomerase family enzyme [Hafnia alvei ATCC 51873]
MGIIDSPFDKWSINMPFVNIKITREGATAEQKEALIAGVTQLLVDTMGKNPATTVVIIEEVETDNWGIGGKSVTELRKKK